MEFLNKFTDIVKRGTDSGCELLVRGGNFSIFTSVYQNMLNVEIKVTKNGVAQNCIKDKYMPNLGFKGWLGISAAN